MRILLSVSIFEDELIEILDGLDETYEILADDDCFEILKDRIPRIRPFERDDFDLLYLNWKDLPSEKREEKILSTVDENRTLLFLKAIKNYREKLVATSLEDLKLTFSEIERAGDVSLQTRRYLLLKGLAYFLKVHSEVLEHLSNLFFIKDWKAIVLERLQEGIKAPVSLLPVSIPPELVEDIGLASHLIRFLPQKACVLVKNGKIVYASSTGDLPEIEGGVFALKGVFRGEKKFDFIVAEDFEGDVEGLRIKDLLHQEEGLVLLGASGYLREPVPTNDFTEVLSMHPVFDSCAVTKEGKLVLHVVELNRSDVINALEKIDLSGTEVAFNFPISDEEKNKLKQKGVRKVSWIDSRRIWRRC